MDITNNHGKGVSIDSLFAYWVKTPQSQKLDKLILDTDVLWNTSDSDSPSDIPTEGNWKTGVNRTIPNAATRTLNIQFQDGLQSTGYEVHVYFNIGCQLIGIK